MTASPPGGKSGRSEFLLLILGFAALVAVALASAWQVSRNVALNEQIIATLVFKSDLGHLLSLVQDAETGQRGFLLTEDEVYLHPYETAAREIGRTYEGIAARADERGVRPEGLRTLKAAMNSKLEELAETISITRAGNRAEALAMVKTERGRDAMNALRLAVSLMVSRQDRALSERLLSADRNAKGLLFIMVFGLVLAGGLGGVAQSALRRQAKTLEAAQAELAVANEGLEAAVAERTSELISANKEIQRFAYIVSHDLRAPLVNVMGFTSELDAARRVLKEQIDGLDEVGAAKVKPEARLAIEEDLPEAIGFIRASTAKMDRLINAILKLSREGSRLIKPESVAVADLVQNISDTIRQQTQRADAEIVIEPGLPAIVTDRLTVEQIFQNLIENAVKYLDRSRPGLVTVSGRRVGALVEYAIEDNGRGIAPQDHERVFELFRRAGAQDQAGEGVGLAFVRANVRRLGGAIRLTSEPDRGSTFYLTFPAVFRPQTESQAA